MENEKLENEWELGGDSWTNCHYCKKPCFDSPIPYINVHATCLDIMRKKRATERLLSLSEEHCFLCGKNFEIKTRIEGNYKTKQYYIDCHEHHLIYPDEGEELTIFLCSRCHTKQQGAKNPVERMKRLRKTTRHTALMQLRGELNK